MSNINVHKLSGEIVPFSLKKIETSLRKSKASEEVIKKVINKVEKSVFDGITTKKINQLTHKYLKQYSKVTSSRYKLKQSIQELGPSGYPFEQLIGEILKILGFEVQVGLIMEGRCVKHEIDVFAEKDDTQFIVECKFHNRPGHKTDVKVPMYIKSRFDDIEDRLQPTKKGKKFNGWIITNTRFTLDAMKFANCQNLRLMSWDYPEKKSLKDVMTQLDLYPITSLNTLTKREIKYLLEQKLVLCRSLIHHPKILEDLISDGQRLEKIWAEVNGMIGQKEQVPFYLD